MVAANALFYRSLYLSIIMRDWRCDALVLGCSHPDVWGCGSMMCCRLITWNFTNAVTRRRWPAWRQIWPLDVPDGSRLHRNNNYPPFPLAHQQERLVSQHVFGPRNTEDKWWIVDMAQNNLWTKNSSWKWHLRESWGLYAGYNDDEFKELEKIQPGEHFGETHQVHSTRHHAFIPLDNQSTLESESGHISMRKHHVANLLVLYGDFMFVIATKLQIQW